MSLRARVQGRISPVAAALTVALSTIAVAAPPVGAIATDPGAPSPGSPTADATVSTISTNYSESSSRFTYSGTWRLARSSAYLGGAVKYATAKGASATFRFTGISVSWTGPVGPTRGSARVYVNGVYVKAVSQYSSTYRAKKTIFSMSWSTQAARTVKIVVVGTSGHPSVAIDTMTVRSQTTSTTGTSGPLVIRTDNVTLDGVTITSGSSSSGVAIEAYGTVSDPVTNLTIRNCVIDGFRTAIEARNVVNLVIENCTITDAGYAGILIFSGTGGRISGNHISRIGPQTAPSVDVNAYGIALTRSPSLTLAASPRTTGMTVSGNIVEDVPTWHGIDTHAGSQIVFSGNTVRRTMRAFFITGDGAGNNPTAITVSANRIEQAKSFIGNLVAVTLVGLQGGAITDNAVSTTYPKPYVYDYGGSSSGVTISGNTSIP